MTEREFFSEHEFYTEGDAYTVLIASGQRLVPAAEGKLVALYRDSNGVVCAVEIETQASAGARRAYVPIGAGVVVKRTALEPAPPPLEPFRMPERPTALIVSDVGEPVAWNIPLVGPSAAAVFVHAHLTATLPRQEHEHVLLGFEDPRLPLHAHDDAHGLTPIYAQGPLRRASQQFRDSDAAAEIARELAERGQP